MEKNRAVLHHKDRSFLIWQDKTDNWVYSYEALIDQNTQSKDLQTALNIIHETIDDTIDEKSGDNLVAKLKVIRRGSQYQPRKPKKKKKN